MKWFGLLVVLSLIVIGLILVPVGGGDIVEKNLSGSPVMTIDLSEYSADKPGGKIRFLFIHHSCGGQLLADIGDDVGEQCIYESHPNGGGLRRKLVEQGYEVHEASYVSEIGDKTDIFDWLPKFRDKMEKVLTVDRQDAYYTDGRQNQVVAFKSCYPNSIFMGEGTLPGDPAGPELTLANAKATYRALLKQFAKYPHVLFVAVTAPPVVGRVDATPLWKAIARKFLGRPSPQERHRKSGALARRFNNWLKSRDGWLNVYKENNVVVFDYYDILAGNGSSNFLKYPTGNGWNSHPARQGNEKAAEAFVPFLNRAVRRAKIVTVKNDEEVAAES